MAENFVVKRQLHYLRASVCIMECSLLVTNEKFLLSVSFYFDSQDLAVF